MSNPLDNAHALLSDEVRGWNPVALREALRAVLDHPMVDDLTRAPKYRGAAVTGDLTSQHCYTCNDHGCPDCTAA